MKITHLVAIAACIAAPLASFGQKKTLDASVYNGWKRIGDIQLSPDGRFSAYTVRPYRGDGYLFIVNNETGKKDSIARGLEPQFSAMGTYLAFKINPGFDTLRKVELDKVNKDKWPKDSLGIWFLANDSLVKFPKLKEFRLSAESDWLAFLSTTNDFPKGYLSKKEQKKQEKTERKKPVKSDGKLLTIWHPTVEKPQRFRHVSQFDLSENGQFVAFTEQQKYKKDSVRLVLLNTANNTTWKHNRRYTEITQLNFGFSNSQVAGLFSTDTNENKRWNLFLADGANSSWTTVIDTNQQFESGRMLSSSHKPRLLNNGTVLTFGVWNAPEKTVKDSLLESEKVKLDLWHWKDARMQPQQLVDLKNDQSDYNLYAYHLGEKRFVQLGYDSLDLRLNGKRQQQYVLASGSEQHAGETWRDPLPSNYYRISLAEGTVLPLRTETYFSTWLSPKGRYFIFFNELTQQLYSMDIANNQLESCLTCAIKTNLLEDINGMPMMAGPQGIIGWTPDEKGVLIRSEHDILLYDYASSRLSSVTTALRASAADTNYTYELTNLLPDSTYYYPENLCLTQFNDATKAMSVYRVSGTYPNLLFTLISGSNHFYSGIRKAKKGSTFLFQRQSVKDYPDLFASLKPGVTERQLSLTNPQQSDYNWATAELIHWNSYEGIPLEGLVYKPENFDPNRSYPLLVYYYELYSDELHLHSAPRPTASIIFPTEYASAGYVVFIPDIRYKSGHPANSAYDCIMSGTDAVLRKYSNIDPKRLGLQGQSWGGYQTAQLITMTDRYAAAMAGAPVGNMFSAYGGIRWGSGYSRQFQYEHSQSRIGKTIWEAPELYFENSPVFHLPNVKTPLLIMHNDQDGAVPWYQGIELYTGLRRLGKPVWLLNYNGDDHNLMRNANRMDLSIRMRQFFDYYLLGEPIPLWLRDGIPAIEKGKNYKLGKAE